MNFGANKTPVEVIKGVTFGGTYLEIFILVLIENGAENHGKKLII